MSKTYEVAFQIGANMAASFSKTMQGASGALGELNKRMAALGGQQKANQSVIDLRHGLQSANREFQFAKQRVEQLGAAMKKTANPTAEMRREYEQAQQAVKRASDRLGQQRTRLREVEQATGATGKSTAQLVAEQNRLAESGRRAADMQAKLQKNVAAQQANLEKRGQYRGQLLGAVGMAASLAAPVKVAMDFEASMSKVGAVARASDEDMKRLTKTARDLGASTVWSASQAAEGMTYLFMAGFSVDDTITAMPGMLDLASAAGIDLGSAADIASNMLSGFRLSTEDMSRVADVLTNTFTASNTTMDGLGETMKYVAPIAAEAGISIETVAAAAGLLGDNAIQGGQAGTAMRAILNRMAGPPKDAADALDELGISTKDAQGNLRDFPTILTDVYKATEKLGSADKLEYFKAIAGQEAGSAFAILVNEAGSGKLQAFAESVSGVGSAQRVAAEMTNNTRGSWVQFQSVIESISITMGNMLLPTVTSVFQVLANGLSKVNELAQAYPTLSKVIFGAVAAFIAFRVIAIAGGYAMTFVRGGLLALRGAFLAARAATLLFNTALLANPIGLIIGAVIALVAAGIWLYKNWDTVTEFFSGAWERVKSLFMTFHPLSWMMDGFNSLTTWLSTFSLYDSGMAILTTLSNGIKAAASVPIDAVKGVFSKIRDYLPFSDAKLGPFSELTYSGMQILQTLTQGILSAASAPIDAVKGTLAKVRDLLPFSDAKEGPLSELTYSGMLILGTLTEGIRAAEAGPAAAVEDALSGISGGLAGAAENAPASRAGGGMTFNINQEIKIEGGGAADAYEQARRGASEGAEELLRKLQAALAREGRLSYG